MNMQKIESLIKHLIKSVRFGIGLRKMKILGQAL